MTIQADVHDSRSKGTFTLYTTDRTIGRIAIRRWPLTIAAHENGFTLRRSDGRIFDGKAVLRSPNDAAEIKTEAIRVNFGEPLPNQWLVRQTVEELIVHLKRMRRYAIESRELYR